MKKIYLIDASSIFYKHFHAIPFLSSKNGIPTNAAFGFTKTIMKLITKYNAEYIAVCFDSKSKYRTEIFSEYKANRSKMPELLIPQVQIIKNVMSTMGIAVVEKPGYEADDLIGMLAKMANKEDFETFIISYDKDLCQLVNEKTHMLDISKDIIMKEDDVVKKMGVKPEQIPDKLGLIGDKVDNIPGMFGIGDKTAIKLLTEFHSLENIISNQDKLSKSVKEKVIKYTNSGIKSKELAKIITDENQCPVKDLDSLRKEYIDSDKLKSLFDALNFISLKDKISDLE